MRCCRTCFSLAIKLYGFKNMRYSKAITKRVKVFHFFFTRGIFQLCIFGTPPTAHRVAFNRDICCPCAIPPIPVPERLSLVSTRTRICTSEYQQSKYRFALNGDVCCQFTTYLLFPKDYHTDSCQPVHIPIPPTDSIHRRLYVALNSPGQGFARKLAASPAPAQPPAQPSDSSS